jgi:hypothetical protein
VKSNDRLSDETTYWLGLCEVMKRYLVFIGLFALGVAIFFASLVFARQQRPAMPTRWYHLSRGMTPQDVRSAVDDEIYDLRAAQGFDLVTHMDKFGHWQMIVRYDSTGHLIGATASYIHTFGFGLLNTRGINIL